VQVYLAVTRLRQVVLNDGHTFQLGVVRAMFHLGLFQLSVVRAIGNQVGTVVCLADCCHIVAWKSRLQVLHSVVDAVA
jgi:hypothetical protein